MLEALSFQGGPSLEEKTQLLVKQAVAAILNADHDDVDYPRLQGNIISDVNDALASTDQGTILDLKDALDAHNNLGCPLN